MCHFKKKGKKQNKQNLHSFNLATRCFLYWLLPCYCWVGPVLVTTSPADMLFITILDYLFFLIKNGLELFEPFKSHPRCEVKLRQVGADPNHPCKVKTRPMRVLWQQPALALCPTTGVPCCHYRLPLGLGCGWTHWWPVLLQGGQEQPQLVASWMQGLNGSFELAALLLRWPLTAMA